MREYIVPIADNERDYDEMFIGTIRKREMLVRCGECEHWHEIQSMELWTDRLGKCDAPRNRFNHHVAYNEHFYCADGERRADDDN